MSLTKTDGLFEEPQLVFMKPLHEVKLDDITALQHNKIHEGDILDYKSGMIDDDSLIKHVTAFANTHGGHIIIGVEETGRGGFPRAIAGIDSKEISKERIEQILLSNVSPRLHVKIVEIPHNVEGRSVLVIQIPDSSLKPHMNLRSKKYYRRYEFEAIEMEEREVSDAYARRFASHHQVDEYARAVVSKSNAGCKALGQIVVIPCILESRLIDASDSQAFTWLDPNKIDFEPCGFPFAPRHGYLPSIPRPSPNGVICDRDLTQGFSEYLELHRNGCVEYGDDVGDPIDKKSELMYFPYVVFCVKLLHTFQFASMVYSRYNYFGDVRIIASITPSDNLVIPGQLRSLEQVCKSNSIYVEREFSSTVLESKWSFVASGIMHEIFNHFGLWRCPIFDDKGNYTRNELARF